MFLPLGLIWNLQRPRLQKIGIGALFCIGWICIAAAIIRVVQIGVKSGSSSTPSSTWLAFWAIIESTIAIIIGFCPGLYATAKEVHKSRRSNSRGYGYSGPYAHGSKGYEKQNLRSAGSGGIRMKHIPIHVATTHGAWKSPGHRVSGSFWKEDDGDSQEELKRPGQIMVTNTIEVNDAVSVYGDRQRSRNNFSMV
jgi:hypothetical protein